MLSFSELIDFIPRVVTLEVLRADLIDPKFAGLKGRIVKTTGDGCWSRFQASSRRWVSADPAQSSAPAY
jgi:hypothetical protein